jgi:hypothetical protein
MQVSPRLRRFLSGFFLAALAGAAVLALAGGLQTGGYPGPDQFAARLLLAAGLNACLSALCRRPRSRLPIRRLSCLALGLAGSGWALWASLRWRVRPLGLAEWAVVLVYLASGLNLLAVAIRRRVAGTDSAGP